MSTIAYKAGVLAADTLAYGGKYLSPPGLKHKIRRLKDGTRIGVCTSIVGTSERFMSWVEAGADPAAWLGEKPDLQALMIRPNGDAFLATDGLYFSGPIEMTAWAIGSGSDFAIGAMAMGASAAEAVQIAAQFDRHSGGRIEPLEA